MDQQAKQEAAELFQKNNGMSIEEAYSHIKEWNNNNQYKEVIDGCEEVIKYIPDFEDTQHLLNEAKNKLIEADKKASEEPQTAVEQKTEKDKEEIQIISSNEKFLATIGYLGFLCILPLILKKDSEYCKFHGKQALVITIIFFLYQFIGILAFIPFLEWFVRFLASVGLIIRLVLIVLAMIQAYRGNKWKIPVIYGMSKNLDF